MTMDKMSMEGFSKCIKMDLERMSDYEVDITRVVKNCDVPQYGVTLKKEGETIAPILYLDEFYHGYLYDGLDLEQIEQHLLEAMKHMPEHDFVEKLRNFLDFESVKDRIFYRLISLEEDKEYLQETPYVAFYDLALVFYLLVEQDNNGLASIKITRRELEMWGVTKDQVYELAKVNTRRLFPPRIESLEKCILGLLGEIIKGLPSSNMYVISNELCVNGAAAILYEGVLEKFTKEMDSDFFLLPSSIHEFILCKKELVRVDEQIEFLKDLVRGQNMHMDKRDKLTDSVYLYDRSIHDIRMV